MWYNRLYMKCLQAAVVFMLIMGVGTVHAQYASQISDAVFLAQFPNAAQGPLVLVESGGDASTLYTQPANYQSYINAAHRLIYAGFLGTASIGSGDPQFVAFRAVVNQFQVAHALPQTGFIDEQTRNFLNTIILPSPIVEPDLPAPEPEPSPTSEDTFEPKYVQPESEIVENQADVVPSPDLPIPQKGATSLPLAEAVLAFVGALGLLGAVPGATVQANRLLTIVLFSRKKIKGVVYDSSNKEPLDPVYVSVIDFVTKKEVTNQLTDLTGRFGFVLQKGTYAITVQKTHYAFPSKKLAGSVSDEIYDNLYFGAPFEVLNENHVVAMDIPMDKVESDWNQQEKHKKMFWRYLIQGQTKYGWVFNLLFVLGFFASVIISYLNPVWWNICMTALYLPIAFFQVYGHSWIKAGTLTKKGIPLAHAIIRVYNKNGYEIMHKTTTEKGNYYMLVPRGAYTMRIEQKNAEGVYTVIHTVPAFSVRNGVINKSFDIA